MAFFPSDHYFEDDEALAENIEMAFAQAETDRERVVLLGIAPEAPEESYGWIEPGEPIGGADSSRVFEVRQFWEKSSQKIASRLMRRGCLWNSFVMVGRVRTFLSIVHKALPALFSALESMRATTFPGLEDEALLHLYPSIPATNFSHQVLSVQPSALAVLRADTLGWNDLGEPQRVVSVLAAATLPDLAPAC